jgi:hypothetical protein
MLKALKQKIWWLAIALAGVSQHGAVGAGAAAGALIVATFLKAIAHGIWLSLPQQWRDRHCHELASNRAGIRIDVRSATLWRAAAGPKTVRFRTRLASSQEHYHACP